MIRTTSFGSFWKNRAAVRDDPLFPLISLFFRLVSMQHLLFQTVRQFLGGKLNDGSIMWEAKVGEMTLSSRDLTFLLAKFSSIFLFC